MVTSVIIYFGKITFLPGLNSFFQGIVPKDKTLDRLRKKLESVEAKLVLVFMITHQCTITAISGISV